VCHEVISPVGTILNWLEIIEEECNSNRQNYNPIKESAMQATAKLKFVRLAFGMNSASGGELSLKDAEIAIDEFLRWEKSKVIWSSTNYVWPRTIVKLLLNLIFIANSTIPRGGVIQVHTGGTPTGFSITSVGKRAQIDEELHKHLNAGSGASHLEARFVQRAYTGLLAKVASMSVRINKPQPDKVEITANSSSKPSITVHSSYSDQPLP